MRKATIIVESRFCGPPDSANGGYICGVLAERFGGEAAEVTLWRPPPLERGLFFQERDDAARLSECDGDENPIAEIHPARLDLEPPASPGLQKAREASDRFAGFDRHPFPTCFVCGPDRAAADGLRIFAGPVDGNAMVAATWNPDSSLTDTDGRVRRRFLWAALDCPGAFAAVSLGGASWPLLLGRFCVHIKERPNADAPAVVIAWLLGVEGRKYFCGSALYNGDGDLLAMAKAVWIEPRNSTR